MNDLVPSETCHTQVLFSVKQTLVLSTLCRDSDMAMLVFGGHLLLSENWDKDQEE